MFFQGLNISLSTNFFLEVAVIFIIICNVFFFDNVLVKLCDRKEKPKMLSLLYKCYHYCTNVIIIVQMSVTRVTKRTTTKICI